MEPDDVLVQRARALARASVSLDLTTNARARALVATIGPQRYGFPLERVLRVRPVGRCTPVPHAARGVVGVAKLEGRIAAVFGGRSWRGLPEQVRADTPVLLLAAPESPLALLVDSVVETIDVPDAVPDLRRPGEPWLRAIVDDVLLVDLDELVRQLSEPDSRPDRGPR